MHYITVDNAISIIQKLCQGCFLFKLDIKSAFPLYPSPSVSLGTLRHEMECLYYFHTVLPFGLWSAPYIFDQFSCMIEWIIKAILGILV